jgi:hypothetical protein
VVLHRVVQGLAVHHVSLLEQPIHHTYRVASLVENAEVYNSRVCAGTGRDRVP